MGKLNDIRQFDYLIGIKKLVECHWQRSEESSPNATTGFFTSFRMTFYQFLNFIIRRNDNLILYRFSLIFLLILANTIPSLAQQDYNYKMLNSIIENPHILKNIGADTSFVSLNSRLSFKMAQSRQNPADYHAEIAAIAAYINNYFRGISTFSGDNAFEGSVPETGKTVRFRIIKFKNPKDMLLSFLFINEVKGIEIWKLYEIMNYDLLDYYSRYISNKNDSTDNIQFVKRVILHPDSLIYFLNDSVPPKIKREHFPYSVSDIELFKGYVTHNFSNGYSFSGNKVFTSISNDFIFHGYGCNIILKSTANSREIMFELHSHGGGKWKIDKIAYPELLVKPKDSSETMQSSIANQLDLHPSIREEVIPNYLLADSILENPAFLMDIANDRNRTTATFGKIFGKPGMKKLFKFLGKEFGKDCSMYSDVVYSNYENDSTKNLLHNSHLVIYINQKKNTKISFIFSDIGKLYTWKLDKIISGIKDIDEYWK
ncbi:MAG: hypothetical protein HW421_3449 [Ignavibacteria bacterium]|nr:hypothetical protein [Ignavibacteria bacterium]